MAIDLNEVVPRKIAGKDSISACLAAGFLLQRSQSRFGSRSDVGVNQIFGSGLVERFGDQSKLLICVFTSRLATFQQRSEILDPGSQR